MTYYDATYPSDQEFENAVAFVRSVFLEVYPNFDPYAGTAFNDLVITPVAKLEATAKVRADEFFNGYNLDNITNSTDEDVIEATLGRYFIEKGQGSKATGSVRVVISNNNITVIPVGTIFSYGNLNFVTTSPIRGVSSSALTSSVNDVTITQYTDTSWSFLVPVEAKEIGQQYNITERSNLTSNLTLSNFLSAFAASDFTGGDEEETNEQAIARLPDRFSVATTSDLPAIRSLIYNQFGINDVAVANKTDVALLRDAKNPLGINAGGTCDVYIRSQVRPSLQEIEFSATLVDIDNSYWEVSLETLGYQGAYGLENIVPKEGNYSGSLEIVSKTATFDSTSPNKLYDAQDAAFSQYHKLIIVFTDPSISPATEELQLGATRNYRASLFTMPLITEIDNYLNDPEIGSPGLDLLTRACVPVRLSMAFKVLVNSRDQVPDIDLMKTAIVNAVAELGVSTNVIDSAIAIGAIDQYLGQRSYVDSKTFRISATVLDHKLQTWVGSDINTLTIVERPQDGVSKNTIGFLIREADIEIILEYV